MRVIESLDAIRPDEFAAGSCVAIGKFDGLHLGHQAILRALTDAAHASGQRAVVLTFANNPLSLLNPEACPQPLMSREQRLEAFASAGIDDCVMVEFDASVAGIEAEAFVREVLVARLHARHVMMGSDFRFGHRGAGDGALLRDLGERCGFTAEVVDLVSAEGAGLVSSSRVRASVLDGDVAAAARMLGRPAVVRGEVVHGDARGREIGFPTANLGGRIEGLVPADGVYAGWVRFGRAAPGTAASDPGAGGSPDAWGDPLPAAISVGNNPTFTPQGQSRVEAYVLDFSADVYGRRIEVAFADRLRGMERYDSLEALLEQMRADVADTRRLLRA